ncbi:MAG: YusW family protein [Psychrobacillus psychrodurans]
MKTSKILSTIILTSALTLGACGGNNNDETEEHVPYGTIVNPEEDNLVDENPKNEYSFTNFDLHIDTPDNTDGIVAQYNVESKEAIYSHMHAATSLQGDAAYAVLQPIFLELQPMKVMSNEEIIQRVVSAFEVDEYTKFDLEIGYTDGETKTYNDENQ